MKSSSCTGSPQVVDCCVPWPIFHQSFEKRIEARWNEWEPWVIMHLQRQMGAGQLRLDGRSAEYRRLQQRHRAALAVLLRMGIDMRMVRRNRLDDPRVSDEERAARLQIYLERRKCRSECLGARQTEEELGKPVGKPSGLPSSSRHMEKRLITRRKQGNVAESARYSARSTLSEGIA